MFQSLSLLLMLQINGVNDTFDFDLARQTLQLEALRISEPITIDGNLGEPAWSGAPIASNFTQTEPTEGAPATEDTEVRVLYDVQNIYFGVFARDSRADRLIISDLKKDFSAGDGDVFQLVLDTFHDERNGYIFSTNAAGAKHDAQMINEGREQNANWDGVWYVETSTSSEGWTAEISIPFRTLKFREDDLQTWGVNFHRGLRSDVRNEDSYWSPMPRIYNIQRVSLAGTLGCLEGIEEGSSIRDWFVVVRPDPSRALQPTARFGVGPFYTGHKHTYTGGLIWRAHYKLNASVMYTHNNISLAGGRADSDLITTRLNYSISTTAFINALVQFNSNRNQWSSNIRFNIIHRPLSDFYVVYNERRNSISGDLEDRAVIAKLTYMLSR